MPYKWETDEEYLHRLHQTKRSDINPHELCDEWSGKEGEENFVQWCLNNGYKRGLVIDRKNTLLGYSPDNCHFITQKENCRNRTDTIFVEFKGEIRKLCELIEEYGAKYSVVYGRLKNGWDLEKALTVPPKHKVGKKYGCCMANRKKRNPMDIAIPYEEAIKHFL
jgi:hypothetical protein